MDAPRATRGAPAEELLELVQLVRRELIVLEEGPTGAWVEETARDLRSGAKTGLYVPIAAGGGLAFRSDRGGASFAHVHVGPGAGAPERAEALARALIEGLPAEIRSVSLGFTGLTTDDEAPMLVRLAGRPGSTVIRRFAMERSLGPTDATPLPPVPDALRMLPARDVTVDALADLDRRAFEGTTDELLIGSEPLSYRRVIEAILAGEVGRFLDEASTALYRSDPPRLLGALLTCEKSPRHASFLDFMVEPHARRRGYGRYLLHWGFRALWALGYERVRLWVSESNVAARGLYDAEGFRVTHETTIYRWDRPSGAAQAQPGA
ncbi:MAG TPA: GNAT family N-acetyltransferase [Thermoplasmata archaeon]|nr:GNAT family N-acetyltransferase [Thermoplasmata archaeon]